MDADLKRTYFTLVHRRGRPKGKAAVARKLLVRLFIMLRDQIDYDSSAGAGVGCPPSPRRREVADGLNPSSHGMRSRAGVLGVIHGPA